MIQFDLELCDATNFLVELLGTLFADRGDDGCWILVKPLLVGSPVACHHRDYVENKKNKKRVSGKHSDEA